MIRMYEHHKLLAFDASDANKALFESLETSLDLDVWGFEDGKIQVRVTPEQMSVVSQLKMDFDVLSENVEESHGLDTVKDYMCEGTKDACYNDFYESYQSLDNIYAKMDELAGDHDTISTMSIGTTTENRDIRGMIVSTGGSGKHNILYNCGIHAREWVPPPFCVYLADTLAERYEQGDSEARFVLDNFDIHLIPILNPDGYVYSRTSNNMWRKSRKPNRDNTVGTDLNRNFCFQWGTGGSSSNPNSDSFMGYECFDNPESKAIADYAGQIRPISYMDIHATGLMWMSPYGYVPRSRCTTSPRGCGVEDDAVYDNHMACAEASRVAVLAAEGNNFAIGPITWVIYQASGSTADHIHAECGAYYAYALEVRGPGFQPPPSNIMPSNRELYAGVLAQLEYIQEHHGNSTAIAY